MHERLRCERCIDIESQYLYSATYIIECNTAVDGLIVSHLYINKQQKDDYNRSSINIFKLKL